MKETTLLICCICLYGIGTFFKRVGLMQFNPYQFLLITGVCFFIFTPLWWYLANKTGAVIYTKEGMIFATLHAFFSLAGGLILAFLLSTTNNPSTTIVMVNLSSIITLIMSYVILDEHLGVNKIIAIILAIMSILLMNK